MFSVLKTNFKIGLILLVLGGMLLFPGISSAKVLYKGTANAYQLNIRARASQQSPVVVVIKKGDVVDVIKVDGGIGGWLTVIHKGKKGYVRNRTRYILLRPVEKTSPKTSTVKKKAVEKPGAVEKLYAKKSVKKAAKLPEKKKVKHQQAEKQAIVEKIAEETKKVETFFQKEMEILDGLNEIDYALNQARVTAEELARENRVLAGEIEKIQSSALVVNQSMAKDQVYASRRLNALYRMHMMGSLEMAGPPASLFDLFVKQNAMKQVVTSDFTLLESQSRDLDKLTRLETDLAHQLAAKAALEGELALQIRIKKKESAKKAIILKGIQEKKKMSQAALASLKSSAKALDATLNAMGLRGSAALDDTSFSKQRGRLPIPARGKIISTFGTVKNGDYKSFTFQSGIDIRVERGEPVRSVFKGEVMFAQWLKGYGNLMIINHGDNYYTLYAHVEEVFKKKGETVGAGEVIATAGDTGSIKGLCLHFEVRHHGKPMNPMNWLKKGA